MATYTTNTTISVYGALSGSATSGSGNVTLYTAPSNGYALVNSSANIYVGGALISGVNTAVAVGPGQTVTSANNTVAISGVEFRNSL